MNLFDIILKGGILMFPILICSIIALAIIIQRYIIFGKVKSNTKQIVSEIKEKLKAGSIEPALAYLKDIPSPLSKIFITLLNTYNLEKNKILEKVQTVAKEEIFYLEKGLSSLATIAGVAPMFGFLGTVTGMIRAFMTVQKLAGNVDATVLAGGIWEALVTTAAGLIVGIPAFLFYNYFVNKINKITFEISSAAEELIDFIKK